MKLYLLCMRKVLNEVISVNKAFQASNADVTKLTRDLLQLYKSLMQMIVLPAAMAQLNSTDVVTFAFKDHLMPVSCVHLGFDFEQSCGNIPREQVAVVRERCRNFILELVEQIQCRLPENVHVLLMLDSA